MLKRRQIQIIPEDIKRVSLYDMIKTVCATAVCGLHICYSNNSYDLPHTVKINQNNECVTEGFNIRYAAISQIGIARWLKYHPDDEYRLPQLWSRITDNFDKITNIGDLALSVWAGAQSHVDNCNQFVEMLRKIWIGQADLCNAVELGWVIQACTIVLNEIENLSYDLETVLADAYKRLVILFNEKTNLFYRHIRSTLAEIISKRIACFADQVYPVLALTSYGVICNNQNSIEIASRVVDQLCRHQGPLGQWWWHYDVPGGRICEEYPVFSVHQDSMAPMAILANDVATGKSHLKEIEHGMRWLYSVNELKENLVLDERGIICRDIERREPGKLSRNIRGICCVAGWNGMHRFLGRVFSDFCKNQECRPYHLGWILYAWADYVNREELHTKQSR